MTVGGMGCLQPLPVPPRSFGDGMSNPWFPLYAPDFIASTMSMAPEVVGAYTRLLCYAWMNGSIPDDMAALQRITGGITPEGWAEIRARLVPHGDRDGDRDGDRSGDRVQHWVHPRMERERERTDAIRQARQAAANNTNRKRRDGDRSGDRSADRDGDRDADRVYPQQQPQVNPPLSPPQAGGRRRQSRREGKQALPF